MANIKVVKCDDGDVLVGMKLSKEELEDLQHRLGHMADTTYSPGFSAASMARSRKILAVSSNSLYSVILAATGVGYNG